MRVAESFELLLRLEEPEKAKRLESLSTQRNLSGV